MYTGSIACMGLNLRSKMPHRKRAVVPRAERMVATKRNEVWAMDFMHDRLADGTTIRFLTVVDLYSRECVALSVNRSFRSPDVVRVLTHACKQREVPNTTRYDNRPEFIALPGPMRS